MKVHLLSRSEAIHAARIQQLSRTSIRRVIAYVFHKQARPLRHLLFDYKSGFRDQLAGRLGGTNEFGENSTQSPTPRGIDRWGCPPGRAVRGEPVGNATPNTAERSIFPGIGLICHFSAGATSEKPEPSGPRTFAKYVGTSTSTSRQVAMHARNRVFVPSTNRPPSRALKLTPFSICRLPAGTTRLELVTSGRSVMISSLAVGQLSAFAMIVL